MEFYPHTVSDSDVDECIHNPEAWSVQNLIASPEFSDSRQQYLYICTSSGMNCDWYRFDTTTRKCDDYVAMNYEDANGRLMQPVSSGCALVGSRIYVLGGKIWSHSLSRFSKPSNGVRVFDTITEQWDFNLNKPMKMRSGRTEPLVVPFTHPKHGTTSLYIFGGCSRAYTVWAERLSLHTRTSKPIADPPTNVKQNGNLSAYAISGTNIILWNESIFTLYAVDKNEWLPHVCVVEHPHPGPGLGLKRRKFNGISTTPALWATCIFWYYGDDLFFYDLDQNVAAPVCNLSAGGYKPRRDSFEHPGSPFLVSAGLGELFLFWSNYLNAAYWTSFQVTKPSSQSTVSARHERCGSFPITVSWLSHVLGAPNLGASTARSSVLENIGFLHHLSGVMYSLSYESFSSSMEDENNKSLKEVGLPVEHVLELLNLEKKCESVMRKLIDEESLKCFDKEELMVLKRDSASYPVGITVASEKLLGQNCEEVIELILKAISKGSNEIFMSLQRNLVQISVPNLMQALGLREEAEFILDAIINQNILKHLSTDEIEALNIRVKYRELKPQYRKDYREARVENRARQDVGPDNTESNTSAVLG